LLWQAIETLSATRAQADCPPDCVPRDAQRKECFEAERLNQLVGK
jgi:serine O-acetyltransferase